MGLVIVNEASGVGITALDIGGMSIRSGVVRGDGTVDSVARMPVDHRAPADALVGAIRAAVDRCRPPGDQRVAIAVPGPFDDVAGVSHMTHKFAALEGLALAPAIAAARPAVELDVRFVNDAAAAGAGEVWVDGRPGTTLVLTLGTGMGASLFVDGALRPWVDDIEIAELWNRSLSSEATADDRFSARGLADRLGVPTHDLPDATADPAAQTAIDGWATELGAFIEELRPSIGFDRVILGGGASGAFDRFGAALQRATTVEVAQAKLGSSGPLLGAAVLAFDIA